MERILYQGKTNEFYRSDRLIDFFLKDLNSEFLSQTSRCCSNVCYIPKFDVVIRFETNDKGTVVNAYGNLRRILQVKEIIDNEAIKRLDSL